MAYILNKRIIVNVSYCAKHSWWKEGCYSRNEMLCTHPKKIISVLIEFVFNFFQHHNLQTEIRISASMLVPRTLLKIYRKSGELHIKTYRICPLNRGYHVTRACRVGTACVSCLHRACVETLKLCMTYIGKERKIDLRSLHECNSSGIVVVSESSSSL